MIFKTFKKLTRVPCLCIIVLAIVQDSDRLYKTVYTTAHEVHSMSELNRVNIVYKSHGIELEQKSVGPYLNPVNVKLIK